MFEGKMDDYLGYEKNFMVGNNIGNFWNGSYLKKIYIGYGEFVIFILCDCNGQFELIVVFKYESWGFLQRICYFFIC